SNPTSRNSWADLWQAHCTTREPMRDDHAKSTGFDSVDTVLRDDSHPSPRQSLRVVSFSNGIEPATIPTGILTIEPDPEPEEVPAAAAAHRFAQSAGFEMPAPMSRGKIMCVFGCRGGAGATMLAVNVAAALGKGGKSVVLVDLDLQLGDVFVALDLDAPPSLASLSPEGKALHGPAARRPPRRPQP